MLYANNFSAAVELSDAADSLAVALPDGEYMLTLSDALRTRWEIVNAVIASGVATLTRGQEGTAAQEWPAGSVIYGAVTAGQLSAMLAAVSDLSARVTDLEAGGGGGSAPIEAIGPPVDAPLAAGAQYIDTESGDYYVAIDTFDAESWRLIAIRGTLGQVLGGVPAAMIMIAGYAAPIDPPTGPSMYVMWGSTPRRAWVAIPASVEGWVWSEIEIVAEV